MKACVTVVTLTHVFLSNADEGQSLLCGEVDFHTHTVHTAHSGS